MRTLHCFEILGSSQLLAKENGILKYTAAKTSKSYLELKKATGVKFNSTDILNACL